MNEPKDTLLPEHATTDFADVTNANVAKLVGITFLFSVPAVVMFLLSLFCICIEDLWILNLVGQTVSMGGHAIPLVILWVAAICVAYRCINESKTAAAVFVAVSLLIVYVPTFLAVLFLISMEAFMSF